MVREKRTEHMQRKRHYRQKELGAADAQANEMPSVLVYTISGLRKADF